METEYYRSKTDLLPTFSLVLAASLAGLNVGVASPSIKTGADNILPASARYSYYHSVDEACEISRQAEALKRFAENLLGKTKDNPQQIVEVLNKHFWDLV